jgi:hypothetical protein
MVGTQLALATLAAQLCCVCAPPAPPPLACCVGMLLQ